MSTGDPVETSSRLQNVDEATSLSYLPRSKFESVFFANAPIVQSFLHHTSTSTILHLYHTSRYLRTYLRNYPLAWQYLSFRLAQPTLGLTGTVNASNNDNSPRQSKNYALDHLILELISPFSSCIKSLEVDNTAVSGRTLTDTVLTSRRGTIEHLSIRGCKNVSLKYHIIPFLAVIRLEQEGGVDGLTKIKEPKLALKSLYTYRCRHHRRRPYLPASLHRRDSDSEPTHGLVELCHRLGIWTDTAWCTTPGARCFRRKGYVQMRTPHGTAEVWVVFDRLWRSKNWVGPHQPSDTWKARDGRTWEHKELGFQGEALGIEGQGRYMEGKTAPMHLRHSHRQFVEDVKCDGCGAEILERCEQCSVMMHCVGCRKTLCHSCAFDRPFTGMRQSSDTLGVGQESQDQHPFWWAPGYTISPCKMQEPGQPQAPPNPIQNYPNIRFKWCCWEPLFSGGGGISYGGPSPPTRDSDRIRAVPLPKRKGWEDPDFDPSSSETRQDLACGPLPDLKEAFTTSEKPDLMEWLLGSPQISSIPSPRNLCQDCYESDVWRISCKSCSRNLCMEHDLRGLRVRICGYKPLTTEKAAIKIRASVERRMKEREGTQKIASGEQFSATETRPKTPCRSISPLTATPSTATDDEGPRTPTTVSQSVADSSPVTNALTDSLTIVEPTPIRPSSSAGLGDDIPRPLSSGSDRTAQPENDEGSRCTTPSECQDGPSDMQQTNTPSKPEQWTGCLAFFCPSTRLVGDHRILCSPSVRECSSCKVNVCPDCMKADATRRHEAAIRDLTTVEVDLDKEMIRSRGCSCSGCENRFHCPNCRREREAKGDCKYVEEERKRLAEKIEKELRAQLEEREKQEADRALESSRDFWQSILEPPTIPMDSQNPNKKRKVEHDLGSFEPASSKAIPRPEYPVEVARENLKSGLKRLVEQNKGVSRQELRAILGSFLREVSQEESSLEKEHLAFIGNFFVKGAWSTSGEIGLMQRPYSVSNPDFSTRDLQNSMIARGLQHDVARQAPIYSGVPAHTTPSGSALAQWQPFASLLSHPGPLAQPNSRGSVILATDPHITVDEVTPLIEEMD